MNKSIATDIHRISPSRFVMVMARVKAVAIIAVMAVILLLSVVAGYMVNNIFYVVGPALILVIGPIIISLIYFYYALSPTAAMLTLPHRVVFSNDKIDIDYYNPDDEVLPNETIQPQRTTSHLANSVDVQLLSTDILITLNSKQSNVVAVVPFDSFTSTQNLNSAMQLLNIAPTYISSL
ncbi:MAG: hypothetical protein K2H59_03130 [Muribaculaceae bacterium]|nr:hypothetical protein [Muribaculaceae bacterium]